MSIHRLGLYTAYVSYGIQMNLLAQIMKIERYANVCAVVSASAIATLLSHALMMIVCWMNDWLTGLLTAPLLGTPTIYNDKQRTTTRFSFHSFSFSIDVYKRERERISAPVHTKHIFSISLECEEKT